MKLVFLLSLALLSCASIGHNVQAADAPAFSPAHQESVCASGCVAGLSDTYLELRFGPNSETDQAGFTYTLNQPFHVTMLAPWIGTQTGQIFESDSRLQIVWPSGEWREYMLQFDKHSDVKGNEQEFIPVDLDLQPGTQLTLYHSAFGVISCPQSCGYDTTWRLYAK